MDRWSDLARKFGVGLMSLTVNRQKAHNGVFCGTFCRFLPVLGKENQW